MNFLSDLEIRPLSLADPHGLQPEGLVLGKGASALEVAITLASERPTASALRGAWKSRLGGRAAPLLLVTIYGEKVALVGPAGEQPTVFLDVERDKVERMCAAALDEPDRHAALRFLNKFLSDIQSTTSGLRNEGLFATHELETGVPARSDWQAATSSAKSLLRLRDRDLLAGLGFTVEPLPGPAYVLRAADSRAALAILLERSEAPEVANARFSNLSPISYALAKADAENLDFVVVLAGPMVRLYPVKHGLGTGQRGRTETYVEIRLDVLPEALAAYLWLIFSSTALRKEGTVYEILADSKRYAADLGTRLRDRIYNEVVPPLAQTLLAARGLRKPTAADLTDTYEMALLVLFRLLFIAYAEDKELLPYKTNDSYRHRSLKAKASELTKALREERSFEDNTTAHWEEVERLFRAVDQGNREWGVPKYNGGLFASQADVSPLGAAIANLRVPDGTFGPVLAAVLVDRTKEGWGPVDFRSLSVREFGTIYEGLLENELSIAETDLTTDFKGKVEQYRPAKPRDEVIVAKGKAFLHNTSGARKSTGSYFTKHFAVEHLLEHGLDQSLDDHLRQLDELSDREAGERFFDFRVADITMGSGHFLVSAVDHIEREFSSYLAKRQLKEVTDELQRLRESALDALHGTGAEVDIEDAQLLRRQIARRCIYGVDINRIAVELARLALWIHTFVPGLPLSFLDHNLVQGNSIVGIATLDEARERLREILDQPLFEMSTEALIGRAAHALTRFAKLSDANAQEIQRARSAFNEARESVAPAAALFDVLTASRLDSEIAKTVYREAMDWQFGNDSVVGTDLHKRSRARLSAVPPFHFPIAFPEVFLRTRPGFDVIVGNPPWEKVRVEEHEFWARHSPGLRGLEKGPRDKAIAALKRKRPDLIAEWQRERLASDQFRDAVRFMPGMNTGHPDLFRGFAIRFWQLAVQNGGRVAVVLPGDTFKIAGASELRLLLSRRCQTLFPQMLTNKRGWVFDDVHPQKLVVLLAATLSETDTDPTFRLTPEFHDAESWTRRDSSSSIVVGAEFLKAYSSTLILPLLPTTTSLELIRVFMQAPRLSSHDSIRVKRVYADFETSRDNDYWHSKRTDGDCPVYTGESFDIWCSDTGKYYAFTDSATIVNAAHRRWLRSPRSSPYAELPILWRSSPENHPLNHPRIAFRNVTNRTNTRTFISALVPSHVIMIEKAPWILWLDPLHPPEQEAYLLGVLSSLPLDWWCRRFVEGQVDQEAFNSLRIPEGANLPEAARSGYCYPILPSGFSVCELGGSCERPLQQAGR